MEARQDQKTESRIIFLQQNTRLPENSSETQMQMIDPSAVTPSPFQTREFDEDTNLSELTASVKTHGVIQPILVRKREHQPGYELIAGERRLRAAQLAGLNTIPAIVSIVDDQHAVEISIIENAQRENLNPMEEAKAFSILAKKFSLSQAQIAETIGKSRVTIANSLRLLQLDEEVQQYISNDILSAGHGKALLMVDESSLQRRLARRSARKKLSVHALENLISRLRERREQKKTAKELSPQTKKEQKHLQNLLKIDRVGLSFSEDGQRKITIHFEDEKSWKKFLSQLRKK